MLTQGKPSSMNQSRITFRSTRRAYTVSKVGHTRLPRPSVSVMASSPTLVIVLLCLLAAVKGAYFHLVTIHCRHICCTLMIAISVRICVFEVNFIRLIEHLTQLLFFWIFVNFGVSFETRQLVVLFHVLRC